MGYSCPLCLDLSVSAYTKLLETINSAPLYQWTNLFLGKFNLEYAAGHHHPLLAYKDGVELTFVHRKESRSHQRFLSRGIVRLLNFRLPKPCTTLINGIAFVLLA